MTQSHSPAHVARPGSEVRPDLEAVQAAVAAIVARVREGGHHVVYGAPGSGRSHLAVELVAALALDGGTEDLLLLAPTRRAASRLRDSLASRLPVTHGRLLVRTPASFAFSVLRARASLLGEPPPTLLTGADQDAILAELLAGHTEGYGREVVWPAEVPPEALTLDTFRHELRDVLMRAAEAGWDGALLQEVGRREGRGAWVACGQVLQEYEEVTRLGETTPDRGRRYDAASILDEAVDALRSWESELPGHPRPRLRAVVHDDYQDATLATARLLGALAGDGTRMVLLGDPDLSVQTFRGAVPGLMERAGAGPGGMLAGLAWPGEAPRRYTRVGEFGASTHTLPAVLRGDSRLREVALRAGAGLPGLGDAARTRARAVREDVGSSVRVAIVASQGEQARLLARELRERRLRENLPWRSMAVLARSSGQVVALRRGLRGAGVPVATAQGEVPLADEVAVRPLLRALAVVSGVEELDGALASELLLSPLGGLDPVGLRALRRSLRGAEAVAGASRSSDELLVAALSHEVEVVAPRQSAAVRRLAGVLAAGREAVARSEGLERVLWAMWARTGLAETWREQALGTGAAAEHADAGLDAVIALFRAAESFTEAQEGATPAAFVTYLRSQEFAPDTLARTGTRDAVEVLTAASAAGREWDVVAVASVQEDVWPDLRLRARLLDPTGISELAVGRRVEPGSSSRYVDERRAVLRDEQRLFLTACTRSRRHLVITAVWDAETRPSPFLDLVDPPEGGEPRVRAPVPPALDLRGLVSVLRAEVLVGEGAGARAAAELLARLAQAEVPGAEPSHWWGHAPSTDAALWDADARVPVNPSALTTFDACPLQWALRRAGGEPGTVTRAQIGTLVHEIAAEHPHGSAEEMCAALDERWSRLGLGDGWHARAQRREVEAMLHRLATYVAGVPGEVATEVPFEVEAGRADLVGRVDRVEHLGGGSLAIVDLKTGRTPVSKDEATTHAQLGAYQAAVALGGFGRALPGGARLVYLGTGAGAPALRDQPSPVDDAPVRAVEQAAELMASSRFTARTGPQCRSCPVRSSCPAVPEGARVGR